MTQLPTFLRKLPYLFYALALIMGGWRFLNEWIAIETTYGATVGLSDDPAFNLTHSVGRSSAVYWGITESIYIVSNGAFLHVLIAIYDKMRGPSE